MYYSHVGVISFYLSFSYQEMIYENYLFPNFPMPLNRQEQFLAMFESGSNIIFITAAAAEKPSPWPDFKNESREFITDLYKRTLLLL